MFPKMHGHPEPQNVTLPGNRIFTDVISVRVAGGGTQEAKVVRVLNVLDHLQTRWAELTPMASAPRDGEAGV